MQAKFQEHLPENRGLLYVLYKIPFIQANFLITQLKMNSHWWALTIIKCGIKLFIHSQTWAVHLFQFRNGYVISSHTLLDMWLLLHAGINVNPY